VKQQTLALAMVVVMYTLALALRKSVLARPVKLLVSADWLGLSVGWLGLSVGWLGLSVGWLELSVGWLGLSQALSVG